MARLVAVDLGKVAKAKELAEALKETLQAQGRGALSIDPADPIDVLELLEKSRPEHVERLGRFMAQFPIHEHRWYYAPEALRPLREICQLVRAAIITGNIRWDMPAPTRH
ncbi:hypothetical protein ACYPKM_02500 [Pseudomonas aeruginosa]